MFKRNWENICSEGGNCGLVGTSAFFAGVPDSAVVTNGPLWCHFFSSRQLELSGEIDSDRFFCTMPGRNALVYGTAEVLSRTLRDAAKTAPERVFIQNNCSVGMIGDDTETIAAEVLNLPFTVIDGGGLKGGFAVGFQNAFLKIISLIPDVLKPEILPNGVNVFGLTPYMLKGREDAAEIKRLLSLAGYEIISAPGADSPWREIENMPKAALNIVVRDELALAAAEEAKRKFGTPFVCAGMPYGINGTMNWLKKISEVLPADLTLAEKESETRAAKIAAAEKSVESLWGPLWFDEVLVCAQPTDAAGIADALRSEIADTERLTVIFTSPSEIRPNSADEVLTRGVDDVRIETMFADWSDGLLLASSAEENSLLGCGKKPICCLISSPASSEIFVSDLPQCGLRGAEYLFEKIWNAGVRSLIDKHRVFRNSDVF